MNALSGAQRIAGSAVRSSAGTLGMVRRYARSHRLVSAVAIIVILGIAFFAYRAVAAGKTETRYILGTVATGTIVASVDESGQVSATDSIDIQPKESGTITWVGVKAGDSVRAGQALMTIDDSDAKQALVDAENSYTEAQLQYQKDSAQAPISYQNDVTALATDKEDLQDDYNTAYNDLTDAYLDLPSLTKTLSDTLYGYDFDPKKNQWNMDVLANLFVSARAGDTASMSAFESSAKTEQKAVADEYTAALSAYQQLSRTSGNAATDASLAQTSALLTDLAQALQSELNFLGAVSDLATKYSVTLPSSFATVQSGTHTALSTANSDLSTLLAEKKTLDAAKQSITAAEQTISLDQVGNQSGSNPISLQISKNSLDKQAADLAAEKADLADYTIVAPFSGVLSAVNFKVGDSASGAAATLITQSQVAELSLNEVDAAKVAVGDKATLTFDAIDGLTLTGTVIEIDTTGTVSQGVVSYDIKIGFDTQDPRVKTGMTVDAAIETGVAADVLTVPASAVKTANGASYVLAFTPPLAEATGTASVLGVTSDTPPAEIPVTTGLSDDSDVEITSGLAAGQQIVTRTVTAAAGAAPASSAPAAARGGAFGSGAIRAEAPVGAGATFVRGG